MEEKRLPSGWCVMSIKDVGSVVSGGTPSTSDKANFDGNIAWITPADLSGYQSKYIACGKRNLSEKGYTECSAKLMPKGTVLFTSRAPIGYVAIADNDIATNQGFKSIVVKDSIQSEYFYYYLKYATHLIVEKASGTTFKEISAKVFKEIPVVVPPIAEQCRIVAKIEELFSELDKGVSELQKVKAQLKVYRQAVLKEAFSKFTTFNTIRSQTKIVTSGSRGWAKYYSDSGAKFIRIGNLTHKGITIDFSDVQCVHPPEKAEGARCLLQGQDVLVSITADLGSIGIVPDNIEESYINQHIALIRFNNPSLAKFMAWYLRSEYGQKDLLRNKRGAGKLGLGLDDIRDTHIPVVSDKEALLIVSQIESRLSVCDKIEQTVDESLKKAEHLRQSILKQAFEGKLV